MSDRKNYLVIGGGTGIGFALAQQLHQQGNSVTITSRSPRAIPGINSIIHDVASETLDTSALPPVLHGLAYCPGSINLKPFHRLTDQDFMDDYSLNVLGAIRIIRGLLPLLKNADQASIVLFSTVAVAQGMAFHASVAASKGALEGLTRSLAAELAPKIRVNAIAPGLTNTPLASRILSSEEKVKASNERHPLKRIGEPDDLAKAAAFLISPDSSWITGQVLGVDGGMASIRS